MSSFSISDALRFGWETFKSRPWFFVGMTAVTGAISAVGRTRIEEGKDYPFEILLLLILISLLAMAANIIVSIGAQKIYLTTHDGGRPAFGELFSYGRLFFKVLFGSILYGLIVFAGLLFFVIPGIYFAIRYGFQYLLIIDKERGIVEALKESARMTKGVTWQLLVFGIVLGVVNVIGALPLGLGLFVTVPMTNLAIVSVYRKLLAEGGPNLFAETTLPK